MNREAQNWLATAAYDLETAEHMLSTGRYLYVIFMCHLSIEKGLKAIIAEVSGSSPPRTHDLTRLVALANVSLEDRLKDFVAKLTDASITTRYPDDLTLMVSQFPESVAETYLERTREVISCIRSDPRLQSPSPTT